MISRTTQPTYAIKPLGKELKVTRRPVRLFILKVLVPNSEVRNPGGTVIPTEYSAVTASIDTDNPKMTFVPPVSPATQGKWILEFKADYVYRATCRKQ